MCEYASGSGLNAKMQIAFWLTENAHRPSASSQIQMYFFITLEGESEI